MADKGYTTEAKINAFLGITANSGAYDDIILAVQKHIEQITKRNFKADTSASSRVYNGNNSNVLLIDDCIEITKVEIGNDFYGDTFTTITEGGASGYVTLPANRNDGSDVILPIRKLVARNNYFIEGLSNQRITAKWGYTASPPADIQQAATLLCASVYQYGQSGAVGGVKSEQIGEYQITFKGEQESTDFKRAMKILETYKKYTL